MAQPTPLYRVMDRARGEFCSTDKAGVAQNYPPRSLDPVNSASNPRAVRHIDKTLEDSQPPKERRRYQEWLKRQ